MYILVVELGSPVGYQPVIGTQSPVCTAAGDDAVLEEDDDV